MYVHEIYSLNFMHLSSIFVRILPIFQNFVDFVEDILSELYIFSAHFFNIISQKIISDKSVRFCQNFSKLINFVVKIKHIFAVFIKIYCQNIHISLSIYS